MNFGQDVVYSFPLFSSLFEKGGKKKGEWINKTYDFQTAHFLASEVYTSRAYVMLFCREVFQKLVMGGSSEQHTLQVKFYTFKVIKITIRFFCIQEIFYLNISPPFFLPQNNLLNFTTQEHKLKIFGIQK